MSNPDDELAKEIVKGGCFIVCVAAIGLALIGLAVATVIKVWF